MKKHQLLSFVYTILAVAVISGLYSFTTVSITNYKQKEYQPKWENLKVLPQDITKDSLMSLMKGYNAALGVKCTHCHTPSKEDPSKLDFAEESLQAKHITRGMIAMTHEINENHFKAYYPDPKPKMATDVSCVMCHRGVAKPKEYLESLGSLFPKEEK